ncbi:hypothetical protein THAOC_01024 [Thalassiosira oceanica]|uniref:Uncharacterized protein n=1 Tax=Thalassiosira oceanica TaxID=159749 RepID=K0TJ86_THAOC|nr:hypothetical protein THAOC_01024 [Thalassiosira oceanica]|eukprot:EJK77164.1 hypothetical protein THAOC_01024 [Thalassiosira oceanica]
MSGPPHQQQGGPGRGMPVSLPSAEGGRRMCASRMGKNDGGRRRATRSSCRAEKDPGPPRKDKATGKERAGTTADDERERRPDGRSSKPDEARDGKSGWLSLRWPPKECVGSVGKSISRRRTESEKTELPFGMEPWQDLDDEGDSPSRKTLFDPATTHLIFSFPFRPSTELVPPGRGVRPRGRRTGRLRRPGSAAVRDAGRARPGHVAARR